MNLAERNLLVEQNQDLVKKIAFMLAKTLPPSSSSFGIEDLIGWGQIGLIEAANNYDPDKHDFEVWAFLRIRGAMIDGMRSMDMFPRNTYGVRRNMINQSEELSCKLGRAPTHEELAEALELSEGEYRKWRDTISQMEWMSSERGGCPPERVDGIQYSKDDYERWESSADILRAVKLLRKRERVVIFYTFWVGLTQSEISEITGMHPARLHQIKQDALAALRERLNNYGDMEWKR